MANKKLDPKVKAAINEAIKTVLGDLQEQFTPVAEKYRKYGTKYAKLSGEIAIEVISGRMSLEDAQKNLKGLKDATTLRLVQASLEGHAKLISSVTASLFAILKIAVSFATA